MKRSLIAVSVLAAASSLAHAQNVTVYGLIDTSVANVSTNAGFSNTVMLSGAHSTSRFGLRGSEDLGGGMRANFAMESTLIGDTGYWGTGPTRQTASPNELMPATNRIFNRGFSVGLSGNFGAIDVGSLPSSANGFIGQYQGGVGGNYDHVSIRGSVFSPYATAWKDNSVSYLSPVMSGLQLRVVQSLGSSQTLAGADLSKYLPGGSGSEGTTADTKRSGEGTDVRVTYASGALSAGIFMADGHTQASTATTPVRERGQGLGIGYTVSPAFRFGLSYVLADPSNRASSDKRSASTLTAVYNATPSLTIPVVYSAIDQQSGNSSNGKATVASVGGHYALSKRTTAYGYYVKVTNSATSAVALSGLGQGTGTSALQPMPAIGAGQDPSALGVGIRHSF